MQVHTFRAESLQAALQKVRQSLGPDASVLHTREKRESTFGFFSKSFVEVEATLDVPVPSRLAALSTATSPSIPPTTRPLSRTSQPAATAGTKSTKTASSSSTAQGSRPVRASDSETIAAATRQPPPARAALSPAVMEVYSDLVAGGVDSKLAKELLVGEHQALHGPAAEDSWAVRAAATQQVIARLNVSGSIELQDGQQKVVAMVGPTGVGKTTTLAKIAAGIRFDLGCQLGLIALDTFRLGAVDQLLQYAELISAPLEVVSSPEQVTAALQRLRECDLVLIDTAGRSPRDTEQLAELRKFLEYAEPDSTQLVVSATSSAAHVEETLERFSVLQPSNLLITKLDEAVNFGNWLGVLQSSRLPISYLTTGQHVPQDIVVASARRLASLLLGNYHAQAHAS